MGRYQELTAEQAGVAAGAPWTVEDSALVARFATGTMTAGLEFVVRIVGVAEEADHHPDIDFQYPVVGLRLTTHATGGLTDADTSLARKISTIAAELGFDPA
ncbi:4a-hydroxytetrahydrobiopterin dehydratase [Gordonia sp. VNK21]|uniref:4a-hydroxytetrahydrobiopterin dehydratase n=1 Tax=Gordonia sp. VNK21 TaxID=3382483 RepID=UPI0038D3617B